MNDIIIGCYNRICTIWGYKRRNFMSLTFKRFPLIERYVIHQKGMFKQILNGKILRGCRRVHIPKEFFTDSRSYLLWLFPVGILLSRVIQFS